MITKQTFILLVSTVHAKIHWCLCHSSAVIEMVLPET